MVNSAWVAQDAWWRLEVACKGRHGDATWSPALFQAHSRASFHVALDAGPAVGEACAGERGEVLCGPGLQPSDVSRQPSAASRQPSAVSRQL